MMIIYSEKPKKATWITLLMLIAVLAAIIGVTAAWQDNSAPILLLTAVMFIVIIFIFSFFQMTYEIHDTYVIGKFWPFSLKVNFVDLKTIEQKKVPWYVGVGFRLGPGFRVMNTRYGNAVHIVRKDNVNVYFTPNKPQDFIATIKKQLKK